MTQLLRSANPCIVSNFSLAANVASYVVCRAAGRFLPFAVRSDHAGTPAENFSPQISASNAANLLLNADASKDLAWARNTAGFHSSRLQRSMASTIAGREYSQQRTPVSPSAIVSKALSAAKEMAGRPAAFALRGIVSKPFSASEQNTARHRARRSAISLSVRHPNKWTVGPAKASSCLLAGPSPTITNCLLDELHATIAISICLRETREDTISR